MLSIALALASTLDVRSAPERPNFLVLRIDDGRTDDLKALRPDGSLVLREVHDRIVASGTSYSANFASLSLCCPSRAAFYSGQYAHNNGVRGNGPPFGGAGAFDATNALPVWLQAAGYFTAHVGKYLNGHDGSPAPGWSDWETRKDQANQGYYYNYSFNENGTFLSYGSGIRDYATDVFTARALHLLDTHPWGSSPFFLVVDYTAPHDGGANGPHPVPAARHQNVFATATFQWPPAFDEADVSDKPPGVQELPLFDQPALDFIEAKHRARLGALLAVDESVRSILQSLAVHGLAENTYVVFLSDNGYMEGEHRIGGGKDVAYEEASRVPIVISGPGVKKGATCEEVVANIDLAPTILELAGGVAGLVVDGISLVPTFSGGTLARDGVLLEDYFYQVPFIRRAYIGLRTRDFAYVWSDENGDGLFEPGVDAEELYPIALDPFELESQHANPAYAATIAEFRARVLALAACSGGGCQ